MATPSTSTKAARARSRGEFLILPIVLIGALVALLLASGAGRFPVDRSAIGFAGLAPWLRAEAEGAGPRFEARAFHGGQTLGVETVGLRVLPLHDADLTSRAPEAETERDAIFAPTQRDIFAWVVTEKREDLPTLVILPKWRTGVSTLEVAHPDLLVHADDVNWVLSSLQPNLAQIRRAGPRGRVGVFAVGADGVAEVDALTPSGRRSLRLPHPQLVSTTACEPLIGDAKAMLFGVCDGLGGRFWLLSDPDLWNNHGLAHAENGRVARELLDAISNGGPVIVDFTTGVWTSDATDENARDWSDLLRFFEFPFSVIWASLGALGALALWRAWIRYGAPRRIFDDELRASKQVSIEAKARLLRLAGQDAALVRAHVADRLQHVAAETLGPHRARGERAIAQLETVLSRRDPKLAAAFSELASPSATPAEASPAELISFLRRFDAVIEKVLHEFGRASEPRRADPR